MSISFVTPLAALVALVGLVPLAVLGLERRRLRALCAGLGLRPPEPSSAVPVWAALVALIALLALAAAQPVIARHTTHPGRADAEAFFVFDVSRSMSARAPNSATRLDRARRDAKELRNALRDVPVGVASITDRLLPHLFPSMSVNAFNETLDESLAIDRPTTSIPYGNSIGTKLGALADLVTGRYFGGNAKRRVAVVFTDAETLPEGLSALPTRLADGNVQMFFFHYWDTAERVYDASGRPNPAYLPDPQADADLETLARAASARRFEPGKTRQAAAAIRAAVGEGPMTARGSELDSLLLTPYVLLAALFPFLILIARRDVRPWNTKHLRNSFPGSRDA